MTDASDQEVSMIGSLAKIKTLRRTGESQAAKHLLSYKRKMGGIPEDVLQDMHPLGMIGHVLDDMESYRAGVVVKKMMKYKEAAPPFPPLLRALILGSAKQQTRRR